MRNAENWPAESARFNSFDGRPAGRSEDRRATDIIGRFACCMRNEIITPRNLLDGRASLLLNDRPRLPRRPETLRIDQSRA